jgi:glycosyltransferase involved in cell wall biosynthesis
MKISIITPSFNQGRYIEQAILSVREQGFDQFEHIIIDNCSTDSTREIVSKYPHVTFISEPDKGQSDALNKGFIRTQGDIIGWLNADDYYLPGAFRKVAEVFRTSSVDAIYSNVKFVNQNGEFIRNLKSHRPLRWMSLLYCYIQSTSFFFKKEIVTEGNLLEVNLHYSMDKEFFARLLFKGYKFRYINTYFAAFRWHESNKSKPTQDVNRKNLSEGLYIINKLLNTKLEASGFTSIVYRSAILFIAKPVRRFLVWSSNY